MTDDALHSRNMVCRKFHDERCRIAGKGRGLLQSNARQNDDGNAQEVHSRSHEYRVWEEDGRDHGMMTAFAEHGMKVQSMMVMRRSR